ncbi:U32 family peptidase [Candidatus Peregrinibacteria bacterium CG_4_9_14_0_2_um_filter_53_11]|nr:MAG: U32 family peptidase [Candidatus Peregrinibacteria bacterium CG_4_9_14_0_2_um_filter_53_11]
MKPELLLPAGDIEKMKFAFQYGADAVYAGVPMLSLRTKENKFNIAIVKEAVEYARSQGKKIYLTVNIFPRNYKIPLLEAALRPMADLKPDAFIVADPGVVMLCKELAPEIPVHLSVQANNVNWASAQFWHRQGVSRIILSREISLEEIRGIHAHNPTLELEFFVHGSICMAYSGRCLLSSYMAYRDANQGICAHSCRWQYKLHKAIDKNTVDEQEAVDAAYQPLDSDYYLEEVSRPGEFFQIDEDVNGTYIMNSKDMCLIEYLKELRDAGVCSFKVEGRNKTLYYAATVARAYRKAIDEMEAGKPFNRDYLVELAKTSNRGFIPGFLVHNPRDSAQEYEKNLSYQTHEFIAVIRDVIKKENKTLYALEVKGRLDAPTSCEILTPDDTYEVTIKEFFTKDGETVYVIHPGQRDHVYIELSDSVPVGSILRKEREKHH